jgi:hypothetical protein
VGGQAVVTPFQVQSFLAGLRYPARKHDALDRARHLGAGREVLRALDRLPEGRYESPTSLSRQISRQTNSPSV